MKNCVFKYAAAAEESPQISERGRIKIQDSVGRGLSALGRWEEALDVLQTAMDSSVEAGPNRLRCIVRFDYARALEHFDHNRAIEQARITLDEINQLQDPGLDDLRLEVEAWLG